MFLQNKKTGSYYADKKTLPISVITLIVNTLKMSKTIFIIFICLFAAKVSLAQNSNQVDIRTANSIIKELNGKLSFQVWQYDSSKVSQKHIIPIAAGNSGHLKIENSEWICEITECLPAKDGSVKVEAKFILEKGSLKSSGVAVAFDFSGWSTNNYVMIPAIVYNGNRFRTIYGGYMPVYPADMYYNKNCPLSFSDDPRLAMNIGEPSKIELSTSNASTPAMTFFSPSKKQGFILLTEQQTRFGNSGMIVEESSERTNASFSLTAPCVRERIPGFGGFFKSGDLAVTWNEGDEVLLSFSIYSFPVSDIPMFLEKFMDVRKAVTGDNHPRNITPMSAILKYTMWQTDNYRWYEDPDCKLYSLDVFDNFFGYKKVFQLGWVAGMMNTFPVLYDSDSLHIARATSTIDFVVDRMQGKSGYFYGFWCDGGVRTELKREIPPELIKEHPDVKVAMVRKNADALLWFCKQFMLLKEQGNKSLIKPSWEAAARRLAHAFVNTWEKNGELGQYIDPENGEIVIFNSTAAAIVPGGLALASKYFNEPDLLKVAIEAANYYYNRDVVTLGLTGGHCGDISQDADSESAAGFLESLMALYWATGDQQWLEKAKVEAALCSTWTLSYDYKFPPASDLGKLKVHAAGAYFASTQNKHAAPGICTSSGDYLFKLYRATGERKYAELIRDIQHAHTEVVETPGRPTVSMGSRGAWEPNTKTNYYGCSMERIQPSDAEGKDGVGMLYRNTSNAWNELNGMLMAIELPGIYLQLDKNEIMVFDHVEVTVVERSKSGILLQIKNPTAFPASVSLFAETSSEAKVPLSYTAFMKWQRINIEAGATRKVQVGSQGRLAVN